MLVSRKILSKERVPEEKFYVIQVWEGLELCREQAWVNMVGGIGDGEIGPRFCRGTG